jgi:hypothetical protein
MFETSSDFTADGSHQKELRREQRQFETEMRERRMMQLMQQVRNLSRHSGTKRPFPLRPEMDSTSY